MEQVQSVERMSKQASEALKSQNFRQCLTLTEQVGFVAVENRHDLTNLFFKGLALSPFSISLRTLKGEALLGLRQPQAAGSLAVGVLRDHPQNPDALYLRAMALYYAGSTEDANKLLIAALKSDPDHANARNARKKVRDLVQLKEEGNALFKQRNFAEAHKVYSKAMEIDPLNDGMMAILHYNRAVAGSKIGFEEQAIADCTAAITLDKHYIKVNYYYIIILDPLSSMTPL